MLLKDAFVLDFAGDDRNVVLSYGPCQVLMSSDICLLLFFSDYIYLVNGWLDGVSYHFFCLPFVVPHSWFCC